MNLKDQIKARVLAFDAWARPWAARSPWRAGAYEFLLFGLKQAWACLFAGTMLALLVGTHLLWPDEAPLARYDFLVIAAIALQIFLLATGLERPREALVIAIFHVVGTAMELFKTAHGSWTYPEASLLRIGDVPLFSGFMYACVGSYMARIIRLFDIRFEAYPPPWAPWLLAVLAYANFFTHHYVVDIRWGLFAFSAVIFGRTWFQFTPDLTVRRMPMLLGAVLVAFFIWIAENLGTYASAWVYPDQQAGWTPVSLAKMGSWYLLMMLSFVLVTLVHPPRPAAKTARSPSAILA
ncbi:DUF817 domain-containing protein [Phenylobacterium sp.]|uniref:DUF817 domain-containing protein n=1 Tax=Phenylobacterium sp. TaxID=1871053 RepID=UPI00272F77FF|nr:DUF817 domain-containing protein [Phenylobacterium sp.]MDP1617204.1 DUF817 domain-containing protein [Phenylobacterium sp.]MDP1989376.1 DUF817 domain-containing protein [Phenylobacterium sp.]